MAELTQPAPKRPPSSYPDSRFPPIPASTQLLAVAWMRWRMFANGFRRQASKRKVGALVGAIVLRLLLWPILVMWVIGPIAACGFFGYTTIAHHHPQRLGTLLAGIGIFWQFIAINGMSIAASTQTFDPASLLRYPLPFGRYVVLRTLLGLLTPTTIVGCFGLFAVAVGIGIADSRLFLASLFALGIYAAANIFFSRMVGAWLERWLANRRFREIFSIVMGLMVFYVQFLNFRRTGASYQPRGDESGSWVLTAAQSPGHMLSWLPPGFAAHAILAAGNFGAQFVHFAALLAWTGLFLAAFALRLHKQFLGEYLSDGAPRATAAPVRSRRALAPAAAAEPVAAGERGGFLSPTVLACLRKEFLYLRGNSGQLMGMITPLLFVFLFSRGLLLHHPGYLLSGSLAYALFGLLAGLYNVFGADGAGVQLYLLAPVRLRDVVLAKNLTSLALLLTESIVAWCFVLVLSTAPIPLSTQIAAALWVVFLITVNLTLGTLRSIQSPRRFVPGQPRQMRTPTSRTSGLLVLGVLFGSILLQIPVTLLTHRYHQPWLGVVVFLPLAAAGVGAYALLLRNADTLILRNRDLFAEELCGV